MRETKIICTLGPASEKKETLLAMAKAGMNIARFNMSHGTHAEHLEKLNAVRQINAEKEVFIETMLDTKGPEVRIGTFENGKVMIKEGQKFSFVCQNIVGDNTKVQVNYHDLYKYVKVGNTILLNDGLLTLIVDEVLDKVIVCTAQNGGEVSNRKGVFVPGVNLQMPFLSDVDKADILFGIENGFDMVAASFVQDADDVQQLREFLDQNGGHNIKIISKIETRAALQDIDAIIAESDGLMVARGDLGVEMPYEQLPELQLFLLHKAKQADLFSITATEMLESMIENLRPTRAEITDVANAVFFDSDAVMLSAESAVGIDPVNTVGVMAKIVDQAEQFKKTKKIEL
ncbi:MAG: pyruvate kinase [Clostridia bacterium]|nr:pyruvate kinase [Clostridia bacterium]